MAVGLPGASPSIDCIDILDFGQFVANFSSHVDPNTTCAEKHDGPHADINGDGVVDALDFSFIERNFLECTKSTCCPGSAADVGPVARDSVTIEWLEANGLGEFGIADMNSDGVVNVDDMAEFMAGKVPTRVTPVRERKAPSLRSSRR